jgi:peptide/nickel transport system substrate-binding protein
MKRFSSIMIVCLLLLSSWSAIGGAADTPKFGGTLKASIPNSPPNLDLYLNGANETSTVMWHVYEGLFEPNIKMDVKPNLVKTYTVSNDGLRYVFELREGVLFHDGSQMTSQDVVASFDRWFKLNNGGQSVFPHIKSFKTDGKNKVVVEFKSPYGPFLEIMASYANNQKLVVFKKEQVEKFGDKVRRTKGTDDQGDGDDQGDVGSKAF